MNNFNYMGSYGNYAQNTSHIQNISSVIPTEVQCFYVNNPQEMEKINPLPNVIYIGLNLTNNEIYLRQINGMGLIDIDTYMKKSGEQQKNDTAKILERIDKLESYMKGKENVIQSANGTISNEYAEERNAPQSPVNTTIQSVNSGADIRTEA